MDTMYPVSALGPNGTTLMMKKYDLLQNTRNYLFSIICDTFKVMKITVRQAMSQEAYMLFYEHEPGSWKSADTTANVSKKYTSVCFTVSTLH